jgi:hypothetical protein
VPAHAAPLPALPCIILAAADLIDPTNTPNDVGGDLDFLPDHVVFL